MDREAIYDKLTEVFRTVFDDDTIVIDENTTADDIEDWDSLEHVNLIIAIENAFNIKFSMKEVKNFSNVGDVVELIQSK